MTQWSIASATCALLMFGMTACGSRAIHDENDNQNNNSNISETCGNQLAEGSEVCDGSDLRENVTVHGV